MVNEFGFRIFYIKKRVINGVNIPVSFNNNRDETNNKITPYSLTWQGDDGLAKNFHTQWQDLRENMEIIKTTIQVNQKILQQLKDHNCYEIDNVLYLPYSTNPSIPSRNEMEIQLVPL